MIISMFLAFMPAKVGNCFFICYMRLYKKAYLSGVIRYITRHTYIKRLSQNTKIVSSVAFGDNLLIFKRSYFVMGISFYKYCSTQRSYSQLDCAVGFDFLFF